ncbi:MAG: leucine-rich repeat domain-containing protein, partial [Planctomycetaceae bacterium]|nr:leucine-rich repeat domain-containing protein [Planctomycetaceae bacterium]
MTCRLLIMTVMLSICAGALVQAEETIPDPNLQQVIRAILEKKQIKKDAIDPADLKSIFFLDARGKGIKSLAGLQHCTNLAEVKLSDNEISDLSPLAELKNIQSLYLSRNQVSD